MRKIFIVILILSSFHGVGFSQVYISGGVNYGNYKMTDIRELKTEFKEQLTGIPVKAVDDFPAYIGFEFQVLSQVNRVRIGFFGGFNSTGSRLYYGDYSGSLTFDQLVQSVSLDGAIEYPFGQENKDKKVEFFISTKCGLQLSNYKLDYTFNTSSVYDNSNLNFKSTNINLIPSVGLRRYWGKFFVQSEIRYHFDIVKGDATLSSNTDAKLVDAEGDFVSIDWSGFRLALVAGLLINK